MRVFVYFNLHRKLWSLKALDGDHAGRVVAHATSVQLRNVTMKVSEAGRQRVLATKRKNVHAGLVGELVGLMGETRVAGIDLPFGYVLDTWSMRSWFSISYNPYKAGAFTRKYDGAPIHSASVAVFGQGYVSVQL